LWNVWDQPEILTNVREAIRSVAVVHVSDWHGGGPRRLNDRLVPGRGIIPFGDWGQTFWEAGYDGWFALELLSDPEIPDSYLHEPVTEVVDESRRYLQATQLIASP
jgi:sugar phosphate isomerase/epimerase